MDVAARADWDRLAALQRALAAVEGGEAVEGGAAPGQGVRRRLARLALEQAIRADVAEQVRRRREEFDRALEDLVARAARRPWVAPPPPPPAPAVRQAPARRRASPPAPPAAPVPAPKAKPRRTRRPKAPPDPLPEFWSPTPVLGFRTWDLRDRIYGAYRAWDRPEYEAICLSPRTGRDYSEVPHSDGRCGSPPCGLYCFKEPEQLLAAFGLPTGTSRAVVGLVALSGKVVEHERGYRAKRAKVLAAAVVGGGRVVRVDGAGRLEALFARPQETVAEIIASDPDAVEAAADPIAAAEAVLAYLGLMRRFHEGVSG
ncbi:MAG: hypothetical protein JW785_09820 [Acidimicrobiia bacterium]|nr:hypothetical protein [Acidimicrobiia bacterium]